MRLVATVVAVLLFVSAIWWLNQNQDRLIPDVPIPTAPNLPKSANAEVAAAKAALPSVAKTSYSAAEKKSMMGKYSRNAYMPNGWNVSGQSCDLRNQTLARDLKSVVFKDGKCIVASGVLEVEPYTGKTNLAFTRGSTVLDIDHIYPLGLAEVQGGNQWGAAKKEALAHDPINLLAVDFSSNRSKSDSGPNDWLPSNKEYRCTYVAKFTLVAVRYQLAMDAKDYAAVESTLKTC